MVSNKAEVRYLCTSKNTRGPNGWTTKANANPVNDIQANIKPDRTKDNIFLKPKNDDRTYGDGWMTVWRLDTGRLRDSEGTQSRWWKPNGATWGDITRKQKMQIRGVERTRERGNVWRRRRYHFRSSPSRRDNAHLCDFVPLTKQNLSAKDVIGDERKCAGRKEKFLEAIQRKGASR